MKDNFYIGTNVAIVDFTNEHYKSVEDIVSSKGYRLFLENYFKDLAMRDIRTYSWITNSRGLEEIENDIVKLSKQLLVLELDEIYENPQDDLNKARALFIVEDAYNYWREKQRFSVMCSYHPNTDGAMLIETDTLFNQLVLQLYRICEEKLQGRKNHVYRQIQAGTNAAVLAKNMKWEYFPGCGVLKNILFMDTVMLRTPIMFHDTSSSALWSAQQTTVNPLKHLKLNAPDWFCFPVKIGGLLCFTYFHKDFLMNGVMLANLFELAKEEEIEGHMPKMVVLFGNTDNREDFTYYYDDEEDLWIASLSYDEKCRQLENMKNAIILLHNLAKIRNGELPIHGSMIEMLLFDGTVCSAAIVGSDECGIADVIRTLNDLNGEDNSAKRIVDMRMIFNDAGVLTIDESSVVARGTEIGSCLKMNKSRNDPAYRDMERGIYINVENEESQAVLPLSTYEMINNSHKVDILLYADNLEDRTGVDLFTEKDEALSTFMEGISARYQTDGTLALQQQPFANVLLPKDTLESQRTLTDRIFTCLFDSRVKVGRLYCDTKERNQAKTEAAARSILKLIQEFDG